MSSCRALIFFASMFLALQAVTAEALTGHIQATAPSTSGITEAVTVNLANGNITVCAAWGSGGITPIDDATDNIQAVSFDRQACKPIVEKWGHNGQISVAGVTRPTQIQITIPNQDVATIINLVKGHMISCSLSLDVNGVPAGICLNRAYTGYPVDKVPVGEIPVTLVTQPRVTGCRSVNCWAVCYAEKFEGEARTYKWSSGIDYADEDFALHMAIASQWSEVDAVLSKTISGFDSPEAFTAAARALMNDPAMARV